MEATKEKHAFTPGPWQLSCIDGVEDSLMVGGGDDGSDIVADVRTYENDCLDVRAELFDDIPAMRSRAHVQGWSEDSVADIERQDKEAEKRLAELERKEKEAHANARLIAAAPAMYEVLQELAESMELAKNYGYEKEHAMIQEVLAKVEGGEG